MKIEKLKIGMQIVVVNSGHVYAHYSSMASVFKDDLTNWMKGHFPNDNDKGILKNYLVMGEERNHAFCWIEIAGMMYIMNNIGIAEYKKPEESYYFGK